MRWSLPAANRSSKGCGQVMGFFVNTLALRQSLDPAQSFSQDLLGSNAGKTSEGSALLHQDLPFERLVRELGLAPDPSGHPLSSKACWFSRARIRRQASIWTS